VRGRRPSPLDDSGGAFWEQGIRPARREASPVGAVARALPSRCSTCRVWRARGCGEIGRHARFRSVWGKPLGGSSPLSRIPARSSRPGTCVRPRRGAQPGARQRRRAVCSAVHGGRTGFGSICSPFRDRVRARPRLGEQAEDLAAPHLEADTAHSLHLAVGLAQVAHLDGELRPLSVCKTSLITA
jgi:hypothetical protein